MFWKMDSSGCSEQDRFRRAAPNVVRRSLIEAALDGGVGSGSIIWQSGGDDAKAW